MSEAPASGDDGRLAACRACGNRVARGARRCPACGAREPTSPVAPVEPPPAPAPARRRWVGFLALVVAMLLGAAVSAVVFTLRPAAPPPALAPRPEPPAAPAPAPVRSTPAPPTVLEPSRSRGRADWLFFFKAGDQLVRMADDAPLGLVIRTEPKHTFADGTTGPAYLLQVPDGGGQRFVDADELERGGRLQ